MTQHRLSISELQGKARCLRCHIIDMTATAGCGHPGGSLSAADIVTALYFGVMRHGGLGTAVAQALAESTLCP
jgi:transketolase N-terminal domain/subunit